MFYYYPPPKSTNKGVNCKSEQLFPQDVAIYNDYLSTFLFTELARAYEIMR